MAVVDVDIGVGPTLAARFQERLGAWGLFGLLCIFTLTNLDGGEISPRIVSAVLLTLAALYFAFPPGLPKFKMRVPSACLLGMTAWGILQTLFFPQKIWVNGWNGVLFWFTAAVITLVGASVYWRPEAVTQFRRDFIYFATGICVLDLLEQASHTNHYYWLIPSRYSSVFGTFSYWNNFAQFVELSLPITLWQALSRAKPEMLFLLLSAIQVGAVVASGSRAGSALVILELLAVVTMSYFRYRNRTFLLSALSAVGLTAVFVYAAGSATVVDKLQETDQLAVRRNINQSSLAMLAEHPITGWGLDTYVPVYRMFARYDDGTYVNRAHNDWLQFAVEGGLPFAALFLAIYIWSLRPAAESGWGIGLIAIGLHAIVDYPFARFGVCGWYFAMVSMMSYQRAVSPLERDKPTRDFNAQ